MNMPNEELKQQLLELHYDLLEHNEAQQLREQIQNDPEVAAAWADTLRLAGKLASAARIEGVQLEEIQLPKIHQSEVHPSEIQSREALSSEDAVANRHRKQVVDAPVVANGAVSPDTSKATAHSSRRFWISSIGLFATAASIGFMILGARYFERAPARPRVGVQMEAQPAIAHTATSDNEFLIKTSLLNSSDIGSLPAVPASISFSVLSHSTVLFSGMTESGADGECQISLPDELVIPEGARMKVTATREKGSPSVIEIPLEPTRCLTHVTIDRPVYRPGETVFYRSVTLNRRSLAAHVDVPIRFELIDPSGAIVPGVFNEGVTERGVGNGSFRIPSSSPGGPYQLVAKSLDGFFPDEVKEFQVRSYRVPRFKKELEFARRSYGPGEIVEADFGAIRAEGGAVAGAAVQIVARVDGEVIYQSRATTSAEGTLAISFPLPAHISAGAGQLSVSVDDGGVQETQSKTIPIQLGLVEVEFYPEGGYLIGNLKNRVYFAARNSLGEPIHIEGEVLSHSGTKVSDLKTTRDGMGRFEFMPQRGEKYTLKVTSPIDVTNSPTLPTVVKALPVLDTGTGVFDVDAPLSFVVRNTKPIRAIVRAVCRGQLVGQRQIDFTKGDTSVALPIRSDAAGVIRVTVLDSNSVIPQPLVERLVYRRESKQLNVNIVGPESALQRSPGEPMRLTLQVTDENDQPTPAVLGVAVVDDASLSLDETERPTLRTHFLLTSEVEKPEDLEHANFYLSEGVEAAESLDLLLGTQGWRRFISGSEDQPNVDFREQLVRLLELDGDSVSKPEQKYSTAPIFVDRWHSYNESLSRAWQRFLREARILSLCLFGLFCLLVLFKLRHKPVAGAMLWLLVGSAALVVIGCSAQNQISAPNASEFASVAQKSADVASGTESSSATQPSPDNMPMERKDNGALFAPADEFLGDDMQEGMGVAMGMGTAMEGAKNESDKHSAAKQLKPRANKHVGGKHDRQGGGFDDAFRPGLNLDNDSLMGNSISAAKLQQLMAARGLDAETLADQLLDELRFPIRQYAHRHGGTKANIRSDFAETLCWQPLLITDSTGKATIRFDLADSITTFRVKVDGHTTNGRIGSGGGSVTSRIPFQIEPKLPLEVTTGDQIDLPVSVTNATDEDISVNVDLKVGRSLRIDDEKTKSLSVSGNQRTRTFFSVKVADGSAEHDVNVKLTGTGGSANQELSDAVLRKIHVAPAGYPVRESVSGVLNDRGEITLPLPDDIVGGSLAVTLRAYPSPMADIMAGVESILREPHGCFEQTSATNYPNTMALLYMQENGVANPKVSRRARTLLDKGYGKLVSF